MRIGQIVIDVAPLRESRDFRWLYTGRMIASAGNVIALTAGNWQVYALTHSPLEVGLLSLTTSVGMLIALLAGGVLADRHDRRALLLATGLPQAIMAGALLANSLLAHPAVWAIFAIMLVIGMLGGLGAPAATAATPALVGPARLPAAAALNGMGGQIGNLGGPALAGLLIAGPGLAACYGADALCFVVFALTLLFVRPLPPTVRVQRPGFRSIAEGFRYVRHDRVLAGMLLIDTSAMLFGMPAGLFPALAAKHFHGGSATFGLLTAAPGFGAIVSSASSGWTGRVRRPGLVVIWAGLMWGAAIVGFGLTRSLPVALLFLALAGGSDMISEILRNALLQIYAPERLRGRLSSLYLAQVNTAPALGNTEAGIVAQLSSLTISVVSGGLACVAGALLLGALIPSLRNATFAGPQNEHAPAEPPLPEAADLPEAAVDGVDQGHLARVVDQVHAHPVHDVGERHPGLGVGADRGPAEAVVPERRRVRPEVPLGSGQAEAEPELQREAEHHVGVPAVAGARRLQRLGRDQPLGAVNQRAEHRHQAHGGAVPVGRRDLRRPPLVRVGLVAGQRRVHQRGERGRGGVGVRLGQRGLLVLGRPHALQVRAAAEFLLGQPDVEVGAERGGYLRAEERAEALPGDAPDNLADEKPEGDRLVPAGAAGREQRLLLREQPGDLIPVVVVLDAHRRREPGQPGLVAHDLADRDRVLAGRRELRPVPRDRRVRVELAPVDEDVRAQRGHRLGRGPHVRERVLLPPPVPTRVGPAPPQAHDGFAARRDRHARPDLTALGEVFGERLAHRFKTGCARTVNLNLHRPPRPFQSRAPDVTTRPTRFPPFRVGMP
jgi:MFS transporter, ENTS family, enterobactin (siderophore) exporter